MTNNRYDRNIRFFGIKGQQKLSGLHVAIVGNGGIGLHIVQQSALLGVGYLSLIDKEELDATNRNRYIGARHDDPIPGTPKVNIGERIAKEINPDISITPIPFSLTSKDSFNAIIQADCIFGCLDNEGSRLILNELCSAYSKPYFDIASEIIPGTPLVYGGRICSSWDGKGCIVCYNELDVSEAQVDLLDPNAKQNRKAIYGINKSELPKVGPSVVSINGVVASLAVTEFMLFVTGIREPKKIIAYYGNKGIVTVTNQEPASDCYYCKGIRGKGDAANVQRYISPM